jgi:hypothetical protein
MWLDPGDREEFTLEAEMAEVSEIAVNLGFDAKGFEKAAREYLDGLVMEYITVDGKAQGSREDARELIDSIEADLQRIRNLDAALLASLIHRLDELRKAQR